MVATFYFFCSSIAGPVELAAVGVSIAVFNQVSRIAIFPLVSITTSFVAEDDAASKMAAEELESRDCESCSEENSELKELIPKNGTHEIVCFSLSEQYNFLLRK